MSKNKKTFTPYFDKVVISPMSDDSMLKGEDSQFLEKGTVVSVGRDCRFLKKGEIVFFTSWGCDKTPPDENGESYYVLTEKSQFILGKYGLKK